MSPKYVRDGYRGCWEWTGSRNRHGYGKVRHDGENRLVHRVVFAAIYGYEPNVVMHRCDNPACFRPDHLLDGTVAENNRDMAAKGRHWQQRKTHCPSGHPLAGPNLRRGNRGERRCATCDNAATREYKRRMRGAA